MTAPLDRPADPAEIARLREDLAEHLWATQPRRTYPLASWTEMQERARADDQHGRSCAETVARYRRRADGIVDGPLARFVGRVTARAERATPIPEEWSGFSGCGVRQVRGNRADIDIILRWCQQAATIGTPEGLARRAPQFGPHVTAVIDAAIELVERTLPGLKVGFQPCIAGSYRGHVIKITDREALLMATARAQTAPLAVLAAMFEKFAVDEIALLHQDEVGHA